MGFEHTTVLLHETVDGLNIKENGIYVDCTLGGAGHSLEICRRLPESSILIGIDQDCDALAAASVRLNEYKEKVTLVNNNFENIKSILENLGYRGVDGIIMDIGVSSYQLDTPERGFSYQYDAPLDMRMNQNSSFSAYDVINTYSEEELIRVIKEYGEELWAARIAKFIVETRKSGPVNSTGELVEIIKRAIPARARREGPHPAKRTFQAIRIEVNNELGVLQKSIKDSIAVLNNGGRLCIITFHSLEDRIVKNMFKEFSDPCICPPKLPKCICGRVSSGRIITRKPILPSENEVNSNPRSRSAKLRIFEKLV